MSDCCMEAKQLLTVEFVVVIVPYSDLCMFHASCSQMPQKSPSFPRLLGSRIGGLQGSSELCGVLAHAAM